jgi:membrane protein YdbS with pleckstrin-like domain
MSKKSSSSGVGFTSLLTLVFITLKLIDKINWSWWWVLSPIWLAIALVLAIYAIGEIFVVIAHLLDRNREHKERMREKFKPEHKSKFMQKLDEAKQRSGIK